MLPPITVCNAAARAVKTPGNNKANATQRQPIRHRRQRPSQARRPARPPALATTSTAARLGPKLPTNINVVARDGNWGLMATETSQHVHDHTQVTAKNVQMRDGDPFTWALNTGRSRSFSASKVRTVNLMARPTWC